LLKRSKTDDEIDLESGAGANGVVLVLNEDRDACELIARLVESVGLTAERSVDLTGVASVLNEGGYAAVVVDSLGAGIAAAFKVLDDVRNASAIVRNIPVIILAVHLMLGWPRLKLPRAIARHSVGAGMLKSFAPSPMISVNAFNDKSRTAMALAS